MGPEDLPSYQDLILPTIRAVNDLGRSGSSREISSRVLEDLAPSDEMLSVCPEGRPGEPVLLDRIQWGRSYAKLIGALESPTRGVFLLTALGTELLAEPEDVARERVRALDREYRRNRVKPDGTTRTQPITDNGPGDELQPPEGTDPDIDEWRPILLRRLHRLTPTSFEEFVLYLLRSYGLELKRVGGSGDEGIDGIGTAPISPVLSSRVAVQVKRYNPDGRPIGREVVALFQRDAQTKGAERAILVTLGNFTDAARKAATATTPTVDLIDGERLTDLILDKELGVRREPRVDESWFDRFNA
ncbi:MAG: restriction endonuclease [Candidatus Nanopelagicales bacterium]